MRLNGSISEELFTERSNKIENDLFEVSRKYKGFDASEIRKKTQKVIELAGCLYKAYQGASDTLKANIIRSGVIELILT
ncbi:hypothetical protein [Motiliproteus sp. MSK22-1]|uniref:hypothetical protein n=1 Tax=Motiliproteus sp. MSK22-1 TaxID=1897630 RepID=UPI0009772A27|nr:hypothetical protein [Motiliproteus sp. MSK22-1]OMH28076.1 hypothetical protein BGP75_22175 [Motiliproteus sp. MSK22-1]